MTSFRQRICDVLIAQRMATKGTLDPIMAESVGNGKSFAQLLIQHGVVSESQLAELLSNELGLPMISFKKYRIDPEIARLIPERLARQHQLIALTKFGERLVVAMSDPMNIF